MTGQLSQAVSSLKIRNFRLYFIGQTVSVSGNWMQQIALAWLVLKLTNSPFALGITTALQSVPFLLIGPWAGLIADRFSKRKLLIGSQFVQIFPPLLLFFLTERGEITVWMVYVLVACRGLVNTLDNPTRQSFVGEMVGDARIVNAVSLNASITQAGRLIGPAIASLVIATAGLSVCFLLNSLTFVVMGVMLLAMKADQLRPTTRAPGGKGQLRAALTVVNRDTRLRVPLLAMAVVGLLSFNFMVVLPAVARFTFHGTATTYALMMNLLAVGALAGALITGVRTHVTPRLVAITSVAFGATLALAAAANNLAEALIVMAGVGATSVMFSASVQACLQLASPPNMRGRIIALYQLVYQGTTPLGALAVGALAEAVGARSGFVLGAVGAGATGGYALWATRSSRTAKLETALPIEEPL
ncbi:MAG TPA: MFS transporter [Gaiellaceae bacterium]